LFLFQTLDSFAADVGQDKVRDEVDSVKTNAARNKSLKCLHLVFRLTLGFSALLLPALAAGQAAVVQVNSNPAVLIETNSVAVPFTNPQVAGNLNIVVVGWDDTSATIGSVADSAGNTYELAAGTLSTAPAARSVSQAIYYAKNIKSGVNTVTVTFNQNTAGQSVRVVEYSGLDLTNPVDTSVGASGNTALADSGPVATNSANDLLFGAGGITTGFNGPGTGFTERLLNGFGDIIEDQSVVATGSYNATATLSSGSWVMQMVAFRVAGQIPPTFSAPAITSLSTLSSPEAGGVPLTITGTNFEPGATVLFSGGGKTASGVNCTVTLQTAPNATIACLTPSFPDGAATITVTNVDGQPSPTSAFSFIASTPFASASSPGLEPSTGTTNGGTLVTIFGSDFAAGATVTVGGVPAYNVSVANNSIIFASVPAGSAGAANVVVTNPSLAAGSLPGGYTYATVAGMSFVQANSAQPASPAPTATVNYSLAQTVGNLNVVIIGWDDATATVQSVVDTAGNTYTLAFTPTVGTAVSQAIYYAKNIKASASNVVTVTFSVAAVTPDVRILEYSGLDTVAPLDAGGGNAGTGTALDSGLITTNNPSDLIIGASMGGVVTAPGRDVATVAITPGGASVEHHIDQPAGMVNATATLAASANWVMQAVAFGQGTAPDFFVGVTPPTTASAIPGAAATYTVSVTGFNGFNSAVTLTCSAGLPAGATCAFVPPSVTATTTPVTSTLTITTSLTTPLGMSNVTVTGTSGVVTHDTPITLTVIPAPDFTIAGSALTPASVQAGASATSTITIAALNGLNSAVNLTCAITPAVTAGPTCGFVPTPITGSGTSALTVSTSATTPVGPYTVTVSGTSGALTHTTPLAVTVTPGPDFTIAASALTPTSVAAGASAASTITIAPLLGFNSAVNLTCSVTPVATRIPTCSFNPTSVANGSGTSTLTVSTTAATTASLAPHSRGVFFAMFLPIGGLALLGAGFTSRKKRFLGFLCGCLMFSGLIFLGACGGSSSGGGGNGQPGTPAGTYTVTVTGTAGALTHSTTVSLTVQ
jgi:IPT/TIG domain